MVVVAFSSSICNMIAKWEKISYNRRKPTGEKYEQYTTQI